MSSFVKSEEYGFWISDGLLEVWLLCLVRELDALLKPSTWSLEARQHWYLQATIGMMGCVSPNVDAFATSDERRQELIGISEQALIRLLENNQDRDLNIEHWSGFGLHDTTLNTFLCDMADFGQVNLIQAAKQFIKLLRGEVRSDVSDQEAVSWIYE